MYVYIIIQRYTYSDQKLCTIVLWKHRLAVSPRGNLYHSKFGCPLGGYFLVSMLKLVKIAFVPSLLHTSNSKHSSDKGLRTNHEMHDKNTPLQGWVRLTMYICPMQNTSSVISRHTFVCDATWCTCYNRSCVHLQIIHCANLHSCTFACALTQNTCYNLSCVELHKMQFATLVSSLELFFMIHCCDCVSKSCKDKNGLIY